MTYEEIIAKIRADLEEYKDEKGLFCIDLEYYSEFEFSDSDIQKILSSSEPEETFIEIVDKTIDDMTYSYTRQELLDYVKGFLRKETVSLIEENDFDFDTFVDNEVYFIYDEDEIKAQEIDVDIVLDTGDMNTDFSENIFANGYYFDPESFTEPEHLPQYSSLVWLCEEQGVSREELIKVLHGESLMPAAFEEIREKRENLIEELRKYGMTRPADGTNKSYYNRGAYARYESLKKNIREMNTKIENLTNIIKKNSITFVELKENNPDNERVQNLTETEFLKMKDNILSKNYIALDGFIQKKNRFEASLMSDSVMRKVHALDVDYQDISEKYLTSIKESNGLWEKQCLAESVISEYANTVGSMNALTFCVKMTVEEAMKISAIKNNEAHLNNSYYPDARGGLSSITLSKDTLAGLYSPWQGATSTFDIKLAKDIVIPVKFIFSANIDDTLGYSIKSICDMDYTKSLIAISEAPEKNLETMITEALSRSGGSEPGKDKVKDDIDKNK